ncbi:hypothetical protein E1B28_004181 [Marasmius oreades]|uniref:Uncharacterized protein n=1 Tax=Marasmius oreades TaxID=181124 RepID=A0A9P7UY67_9AGAR|nr:uncharacterized protein E1B28_004181 [Marasmius oreades]KAG7096770.1 hypothetical protein E1B28_004181 [Marasmius oreades]
MGGAKNVGHSNYRSLIKNKRADLNDRLPGPPLSNETALGILLEHGVVVGIGVEHPQLAANTPFDLREVRV